MAIQDDDQDPRRMQVRTGADHRFLQHAATAHEHRDADSGSGACAVRPAAAMLEKRVGRDVGSEKVPIFGASPVAARCHRTEGKALRKDSTVN